MTRPEVVGTVTPISAKVAFDGVGSTAVLTRNSPRSRPGRKCSLSTLKWSTAPSCSAVWARHEVHLDHTEDVARGELQCDPRPSAADRMVGMTVADQGDPGARLA